MLCTLLLRGSCPLPPGLLTGLSPAPACTCRTSADSSPKEGRGGGLSIRNAGRELLLPLWFLARVRWAGMGEGNLQFQVRDKGRKEIHKNSQMSTLGKGPE